MDTCGHNVNVVNFIFNNPDINNVEFNVKGQKIYAIKQILSFSSEFMRAQFEGEWQSKSSIVIGEESNYETYLFYLQYLYTDRLEITVDQAMDLGTLAMRYNEVVLKQRCIDIIKNSRRNIDLCQLFQVC